jgi:hypothetical protein
MAEQFREELCKLLQLAEDNLHPANVVLEKIQEVFKLYDTLDLVTPGENFENKEDGEPGEEMEYIPDDFEPVALRSREILNKRMIPKLEIVGLFPVIFSDGSYYKYPTQPPLDLFPRLLNYAKKIKRLPKVFNFDIPRDNKTGLGFGALSKSRRTIVETTYQNPTNEQICKSFPKFELEDYQFPTAENAADPGFFPSIGKKSNPSGNSEIRAIAFNNSSPNFGEILGEQRSESNFTVIFEDGSIRHDFYDLKVAKFVQDHFNEALVDRRIYRFHNKKDRWYERFILAEGKAWMSYNSSPGAFDQRSLESWSKAFFWLFLHIMLKVHIALDYFFWEKKIESFQLRSKVSE